MVIPFVRVGKVTVKVVLFQIGLIFLFISSCFAAGSGAFRVELVDAEALAKGEAFVGEADNPSAVFYNPAGLTQLKGQNQLSLGLAGLFPAVTYKNFAGAESQMVGQSFLIPNIYFVSDFGLEKFAFGLGGSSNWGTGTEWNNDSFSGYTATRSDVTNTDVMFSGAYKLTEKLSLGLSLDHDYSAVNKSKRLQQTGGTDGDFQLKGKTGGWGYRLAALYELNEHHQFGLQYRSPIEEKY